MVYITGDTHGDFSRFKSPAARRIRRGDTLIVLGDFGFLWDGSKKEKKILKQIGKLRYNVLFLDGPHENYDLLRDYPISEWNGGLAQIIDGKLVHLLRGEIYTLEFESYFVFGGGESPDHDVRSLSQTWWEEESPSAEEMMTGRQHLEEHSNKVDFILSHEFPGKVGGYLGNRVSRMNGVNVYLGLIENTVEYGRWFFGSLHLDKIMSKSLLAVFQQIVPVHEPQGKSKRRK